VEAAYSGRNDLIIDGKKFSGNAQYVRRDVVLHHGSLLFDTDLEALVRALSVDDEKIVSKGIQSVRQRVTNIADYLPEKISSLAFRDVMLSYLLRDMETYVLTEQDIRRIVDLRESIFDRWNGTLETIRSSTSRTKAALRRQTHGACFRGKRRHQRHPLLWGFLCPEGLEQLQAALRGCRYEPDAVRAALVAANAQDFFYQITLDELFSCII
jgi:lipoate-protein ligase A